jgi:hypothetical protein
LQAKRDGVSEEEFEHLKKKKALQVEAVDV